MITYNIDRESKVIYISFGAPRPATTQYAGNGIYTRHDMQTDELVGVTIIYA